MFLWIAVSLVCIPDLLLFLAQGLPLLCLFANVQIVQDETFFQQLSRSLNVLALFRIQLFGLCNRDRFSKHSKFCPMIRLITCLESLIKSLKHFLTHRGALPGDDLILSFRLHIHARPRCLKCLLLVLDQFEGLRLVQLCL